MHLAVKVALLLAVENHEINAILERLKGRRDSLVRVYVLMQVASPAIDAAFDQRLLNLPFGQDAHEPALMLTLLERFNFLENDP